MPGFLLSLRYLLGPVLLLLAAQANATVWAFPGNLPSTCSGSNGTYTCSALSLNTNDSITIATATTITVTGSVSLAQNNINYPTSAGALVLVFSGSNAVTLGSYVKINGSVSTTNAALTVGGSNIVVGAVSSAAAFTTASYASITGNVTAAGAAVLGNSTTLVGTLSAASLSDGGGVTYGSTTVDGSITTTTAAASSLGYGSNVYGSMNLGGALTLNTNAITGAVTVGGTLQLAGVTVGGNVVAASLNESYGGCNYGGSITTTGSVSMQYGSKVTGSIIAAGTVSAPNVAIKGSVSSSASGTSTIGGGSSVGGNLSVANGTLSATSLTVTGSVTAATLVDGGSGHYGSLTVSGNASLGYYTAVNGTTTIGGLLSMPGGANNMGGTITINGSGTMSWPSSSITVHGDLISQGPMNISQITLQGNAQVNGALTISGTVSGNVTATSIAGYGGGQFVIGGNASATGAFSSPWAGSVAGTVTAGSFTDGGGGTYTGAVTLTGNGTLGSSSFGSNVTAGGTLALGNGRISGNVTVAGALTAANWGVVVYGNVVAASFTDNGCGGTYQGNVTVAGGTLALCSTVKGNVVNDATSGGVININSNASVNGCVLTNTTSADSLNVNAWNPSIGAVCCYSGGQCLATSNQCYAVSWWFGQNKTSLCSGLGGGSVGGGTATPASFNAVASGAASTSSHLYTQLVNNAFTLDVYALNSDGTTTSTYTGPVKVELVNVGSGSCATTGATCQGYANITTVTSSSAMTAGMISGLSVPAISSAYRDVCVRITSTTSSSLFSCSSGNFTIRPQTLSVTAYKSDGVTLLTSNAGGATATPTLPASGTFILKANSGVSSYNGTPTVNTSAITDFLGSGIAMGTLWGSVASMGAASSGVASGSYTYGEVGYFNLAQNAVSDSTYTAGSNNQSNGDCVANSASNTAASGLYGCTIGSAATSWGRFVPDHFALASGTTLVNRTDIAGCSSSAFTYMGEDFKTTFTLVAQNGNNQTTTNYAGAYAKMGPLTNYATFGFAAAAGTLAQGSTAAPTGSWAAGQAAVTAYHQLTRSSSVPSAPYAANALTLSPSDSDGVTVPSALALGSTGFYYGRLQLSSYSGALNTSLQLPMRAYYWSGASSVWITQTLDSCTVIPAAAVALSSYQSSVGASTTAWTTSATGGTLTGGQGVITLAAPSLVSGSTLRPGSVSVALNLGSGTADVSCLSSHPATTGAALSYLRSQNGCQSTYSADPAVTATFGVYTPESTKTMYLREIY